MRLLVAVVALAFVLSGCFGYIDNPPRTTTPRAEGKHIARIGVSEILLGGLIGALSYYGFTQAQEGHDGQEERAICLLGIIGGGLGVLGGTADVGIGIYQMISNNDAWDPQ